MKCLEVLCPIGSAMLNWVMRHIKLVVAIVLSLVVVVVCYVAVQQGVIDDDSPIREVPFNK